MSVTFSSIVVCESTLRETRKRTHLQGAPTSNTQLHSTFICGLALLYAVFLKPSVLPMKDVFAAIKAASNTLFAYANLSPNASPLFDVFEELSSACIDRISRGEPALPDEASKEWQKASQEAATNLGRSQQAARKCPSSLITKGPDSAIEYADLFQSLGIEMDNEPATLPDGLWDVSTFFPFANS